VHHAGCITIPKNKGFCNFVAALEAVAAATRRSRDSTAQRESQGPAAIEPDNRIAAAGSRKRFHDWIFEAWRTMRQSQSGARSREPEETFVRYPAKLGIVSPGGLRADSARGSRIVHGRFGARRGPGRAKSAHRPPAQQSAAEMEPIENIVTKQRFAMKVGSRSRVICATPVQKRSDLHRSERFLYCVCRSLR
jgi:hypothetical protein